MRQRAVSTSCEMQVRAQEKETCETGIYLHCEQPNASHLDALAQRAPDHVACWLLQRRTASSIDDSTSARHLGERAIGDTHSAHCSRPNIQYVGCTHNALA